MQVVIKEVPVEVEKIVFKEVPVEVEKIVFKEVPGIRLFPRPTLSPPLFWPFGSVRKCHEQTYAWLDALTLSVRVQ